MPFEPSTEASNFLIVSPAYLGFRVVLPWRYLIDLIPITCKDPIFTRRICR